MVRLTQPSITGVPLMRREVDRLLVVPSTEIRTDGVHPGRRGARRVVVTADAGPPLGRSCRQGWRRGLQCHDVEGRSTGPRPCPATGHHRRGAQRHRQGLPTGLIGAETVTAEAWAPWV